MAHGCQLLYILIVAKRYDIYNLYITKLYYFNYILYFYGNSILVLTFYKYIISNGLS